MLLHSGKTRVISYLFVTSKVKVMLIGRIWISHRDQMGTFINKWVVTVGSVLISNTLGENGLQPGIKALYPQQHLFPLKGDKSLHHSPLTVRRQTLVQNIHFFKASRKTLGKMRKDFSMCFRLQNLKDTWDNQKDGLGNSVYLSMCVVGRRASQGG